MSRAARAGAQGRHARQARQACRLLPHLLLPGGPGRHAARRRRARAGPWARRRDAPRPAPSWRTAPVRPPLQCGLRPAGRGARLLRRPAARTVARPGPCRVCGRGDLGPCPTQHCTPASLCFWCRARMFWRLLGILWPWLSGSMQRARLWSDPVPPCPHAGAHPPARPLQQPARSRAARRACRACANLDVALVAEFACFPCLFSTVAACIQAARRMSDKGAELQ